MKKHLKSLKFIMKISKAQEKCFWELEKQKIVDFQLNKLKDAIRNPEGVKDKIAYHTYKDNMFYEFK